jgi:hypothetical protein
MALVVVGGHTRNVGKPSVVAGLVCGLRERGWTAVKITQFGHGVCAQGRDCECSTNTHSYLIAEERDPAGRGDSCRYLAAGALHSLWVRTKQGMLAEAMPELRRRLTGAENVIIESNSVMKFVRPDLYVTVLSYEVADFKESARRFLDRAGAVVLHESGSEAPRWDKVSLKLLQSKPVFRIRPPQYVTPELLEFVRERVAAASPAPFGR